MSEVLSRVSIERLLPVYQSDISRVIDKEIGGIEFCIDAAPYACIIRDSCWGTESCGREADRNNKGSNSGNMVQK